MSENAHASIAKAKEDFLELVAGIRPELHRYAARLTGSIIEGEDIVQETLAKAFYALALQPEAPSLRPWLFKIAHNTALDSLKRHGRARTELIADATEIAGFDEAADPFVVRAAIARFLELPVRERSAVILKDVLGHSLEEAADTMETTVMAVKAALVRGRAKLREGDEAMPEARAIQLRDLDRYASLFNARDWEGLRVMIGDDCKLDLVSKSQRRGKQVGMYFGRYEKLDTRVRVLVLDGDLVLGVYPGQATKPEYFILLEFVDGRVDAIRDFKYVPYIADEATVTEPPSLTER